MGILCGKPESDDEEFYQYANDKQTNYHRAESGYYDPGLAPPRATAVYDHSSTLAHALHSASGIANAVVHVDVLDPIDVDEKIRWAKSQMQTVTVRKDCLYIDYELIGRIPPGVVVKAY